MGKVGLIAGGGALPLEFTSAAKKQGETVIVFALRGMASPKLEGQADKIYWMNIGQYGKFAFLLIKERIRRLALVGKVNKSVLFKEKYDAEIKNSLKKLENRKDYSILKEITRHLNKIGIEVIDGMQYLSHLLPEKGILTRTVPDERVKEDIAFGYKIIKQIAGMDVGQTVVVKDKTVVAVEAMEGTDAVIRRARQIAGEGCVMIKVSRPNQDLRWDVPTVGPDTMIELSENNFSALAVENAKMFIIEKEKMITIADSRNIVLQVL